MIIMIIIDNYDNNGIKTELYNNQIINNENKPIDIGNNQETLNKKSHIMNKRIRIIKIIII